jgi:putative flavoprotein involved in K+ transport
VTRDDLDDAGVGWVARTAGVKDGRPRLEDGTILDVANVIWCTGFVTDYGWIDIPVFDDHGYPIHERGVAESQPGLYFVGLLFQRTLTSALIGGMGRDAGYIARRIKDRRLQERAPDPVH